MYAYVIIYVSFIALFKKLKKIHLKFKAYTFSYMHANYMVDIYLAGERQK